MEKISQNILKILLIIIILQFIMIPTSYASFWGDIFDAGDAFLENGKQQEKSDSTLNLTEMKEEANRIYNILFAFGTVLAVLIGAVLGVKLMFAGIEEKAKIKEMLIPYVVGCVVIFGAFGIWKLMVGIFNQIS